MSGPLEGVNVVEFAGMGPGPFCAMVLGDLGAAVDVIDRPVAAGRSTDGPKRIAPHQMILRRNRRSIIVDLKSDEGRAAVYKMVNRADVLVDPFRPGVLERLGYGPEEFSTSNPGLIYARVTGWGQFGPLALSAGHDINYIAQSGALHLIGREGAPPQIPGNLLGDFGAAGMLGVIGVVSALYERERSRRGQVVDIAAVDGLALLLSSIYARFQADLWTDRRGVNDSDSGRPYYDVYETADGKFVAVGAVEPQFFEELASVLDLDSDSRRQRLDPETWPALRASIARKIAARSRDDWSAAFAGHDACFSPVLSLDELADDDHHRTRASYIDIDGLTHPGPAPRFARTPGSIRTGPVAPGRHSEEILTQLGFSGEEIGAMFCSGAVGAAARTA